MLLDTFLVVDEFDDFDQYLLYNGLFFIHSRVFPVKYILVTVDARLPFHKVLSPCHSKFPSLRLPTVYLTCISSIHSLIFGRAVKNEHLVLGVLAATGAITYGAMGGSKKQAPSGKTLAEKVKEAVPINAGSRCVVFTNGVRRY